MIHIVTDIIKLYTAMLMFYILKLPYAIRVIIYVEFIFLAAYLGIKLAFLLIKKVGIPMLFGIIKYIIYILQWIIFQISKVIPKFQDKGEKFDESLNFLGMKSEELHGQLKAKSLQKAVKQKVLWSGFSILLAISVIFVIIPYHMEPVLSGNAKNICAKINQLSSDFEKNIRDYVKQHYTPATKRDTSKKKETSSMKTEKKGSVLHLGKKGYDGANLRSAPEENKENIITVISGDIELFYEEAWISKKLIRKKDLEKAGIQ